MRQQDFWTPSPPFRGNSQMSAHASYTGAQSVVECWTQRQSAYLQLLNQAGALTDQEAAALLKWGLSSVNSVRAACRKRGLIAADGFNEHIFENASGRVCRTRRTRWRVCR